MLLFSALFFCVFCCAFGQTAPAMIVSGGYQSTLPTELDVAPGQVMVLSVHGLSGKVRSLFPYGISAKTLPLPTELAGISVKVNGHDAPLFRVWADEPTWLQPAEVTHIVVQIPFVTPRVIGAPVLGALGVFEDGLRKASIPITERWSLPHVLGRGSMVGGFFPDLIGARHADGVEVSQEKPAKRGEVLTVYAVGLGVNAIPMPFRPGEASPEGVDVPIAIHFEFGFNPKVGPVPDYPRGLPPVPKELISARFLPGRVGVYEVKFRVPDVPPGTPACSALPLSWQHNLMVNLGYINWFSPWGNRQDYDGIGICVEVPSNE